MKYNREEVEKAALEYFNGDTLSKDVWINKYSLKDAFDNIYELSPVDMHKRIASELYRMEIKYPNPISEEKIFDLIKDFKYIVPAGGPMSGIGNDLQIVSLSNCFVVGNEYDSYGGIARTDEEQVQLMKRRGGVGHDLSHIRPKGTPVKNSALTSTGVVPFMERYSNSTREVAQDGRRGALMLSISIKHPDSEDFIDAKLEKGKITGANVSVKITDEFMQCVVNNTPFIQQYPIDSANPKIRKEVDARKIWKKIVHNAWKSAEPGILYWDTIIKESVPDMYQNEGFKTVSTNPCLVGDTLISVADGRNFVSIKQLAEEGKDVSVYTLDDNGKLVIRTMRNPRITGFNEQIYKLTIEGGHTMRITGNHKFRLKDGSYKQTKDLIYGDSLHIMTKWENPIRKEHKSKKDYMWLSNGDFKSVISEHRFIYEQINNIKLITGEEVIHHCNYNTLDNNIENLKKMTVKEHNDFHIKDMIGDKNPYHKMTDEWKFNFASHIGESNHTYINISNDELINHAKILTEKLNKRFSKKDWIEYATENNIPTTFSNFRSNELNSVISLSKKVALELGYDNIDTDPRLVNTYKQALNDGYNADIVDNEVIVTKICETCGKEFKINYFRREISFCSHECALKYINNDVNIKNKRTNTLNETYNIKGQETKQKQLKIYKELEFNLNRTPFMKEWETKCKENKIPCRLKTKYGFLSFKELIKESEFYNHKVISVELDGNEDVYNGTVDDFHNFFSGGFKELTKDNKPKYLSINQLNCGEIPLCPYDSCRLLSLNLYSYVEKPFTLDAKFNWDLFEEHTSYGQRFMDDIVDLEIEKINTILNKINNDPESEEIKRTEYNLWIKIKEKAQQGRRTGLGITAEGDMLAALGLKYGTKEATNFSESVHKSFALSAYKSSIIMSKERGAFGVFNFNQEIDNPFIQRIWENLDEEYRELYKTYGRRNISMLTIAPTGSLSIVTQTTSGIEPVFMIAYMRRRKINPNDKSTKATFTDETGDMWEEYNVFHPKFKVWAEMNGYNIEELEAMKSEQLQVIIEQSPYFGATSNDVDWVEKVEMQGKVQKWIDHSISVTVNLPNSATEELVSQVYETGWKAGCKGLTIYRDGSRAGVLVSRDTKKSDIFTENDAPKRPKILPCDVMRFTIKGEKWIGFLGLYENRPYEIFTGVQDKVGIPTYVETGEIIKLKMKDETSRYDFIYTDKDGYQQEFKGLNRTFNREYWNSARTISALFRHGMPLPNLMTFVDKLDFEDSGNLVSWKNGVKRMIKKYVKDGTKVMGETCPECKSTKIIYKEGCKTCLDCSWSKCD